MGFEEGSHRRDLEVRGELELAVLEVILLESIAEAEGLVDVESAVERREIDDDLG